MNEIHLTTIDNPHNPFTNWTRWYAEDLRLGYDTLGLLARFTQASSTYNDDDIEAAMRTIVGYNFYGVHIVVTPDDYDPELKPQLKALPT